MKCTSPGTRFVLSLVLASVFWGCSPDDRAGTNTGNPSCALDACKLPYPVEWHGQQARMFFNLSHLGSQWVLIGYGDFIEVQNGACVSQGGLVGIQLQWYGDTARALDDGSVEVDAGEGLNETLYILSHQGVANDYPVRSFHMHLATNGHFEATVELGPEQATLDSGNARTADEELRFSGVVDVACDPGQTTAALPTAATSVNLTCTPVDPNAPRSECGGID